jgi:hypothetical protein
VQIQGRAIQGFENLSGLGVTRFNTGPNEIKTTCDMSFSYILQKKKQGLSSCSVAKPAWRKIGRAG